MWSNQQYFNDKLKVQRSCAGKFVVLPTNHGTGQTGAVSLYWPSVSPLSNKNVMSDFRLSLEIKVDATASANTDTYFFVKNVMHASRSQVIYNGVQTFQGIGWQLMPILECYSEEFKSQSNLLINDDYTYTPITNCDENTSGRGVKASGPGAVKFYAHINTFIPNELLLGIVPGRPMNITINFDNNLYSVLSSSTTGTTCKISKCVLQYCEWETGSTDMAVGLPHFMPFSVDAHNGAGDQTVSNDTHSDNGVPAYVFNHLAQMGSVMSASTSYVLQKPKAMETANIDVNNQSGVWNITDKYDIFGRCKSAGYKHTLQDMMTNHAVNSTGMVLKVDMSKVSTCNISSKDIFRYHARIEYIGDANYQNVYFSTVYCYPSILHVSDTETTFMYTTDEMIGELGDYDPLDYMIVGSGIWDRIKSFGKKIITNAPALLDKSAKIAGVIAPNSGFTKGITKASDMTNQISNILQGNSTQIF